MMARAVLARAVICQAVRRLHGLQRADDFAPPGRGAAGVRDLVRVWGRVRVRVRVSQGQGQGQGQG